MPLSQMAQNALEDPNYMPYCGRCTGLYRMAKIEPFYWGHHCGAKHDEREEVAAHLAAPECSQCGSCFEGTLAQASDAGWDLIRGPNPRNVCTACRLQERRQQPLPPSRI